MDQAPGVRIVQSLGHGRDQACGGAGRRPASGDLLGQVAAGDEPRDHETQAVVAAANVEDRHNVRMLQARDDAGLGHVRLGVPGPGQTIAARHLDGHGALQLFIVALVNDAEAALAQELVHPVASQASRHLVVAAGT